MTGDPAGAGTAPASRHERAWPLSRMAATVTAAAGLFAAGAVLAGGLSLLGLTHARARVVNTLDPAALAALRFDAALVNQETGVRGYALSAQRSFLVPYRDGLAAEMAAVGRLRVLLSHEPPAQAALARTAALAAAWRAGYARPTIAQVQAAGRPVVSPGVVAGKAAFDRLRRSAAVLESRIGRARLQATAELHHAVVVLVVVGAVIAAVILIIMTALAAGLRTAAIRPLSRLAAEARRVAAGDFGHPVRVGGPREIRDLAADVNSMRTRILAELSAVQAANAELQERSADLQRSNAELEQFAYVASHDLQEPLRKVTSFCQLLQRRYAGQLDERANTYINLAVDGALRMQVLINDLLSFGRVGRAALDGVPVSTAAALGQARANLAREIEATGAIFDIGELPVVLGKESLITAVFGNLISNSLKFRGSEPPHIAVSARREGTHWLFSFADNGIGVEPEFADRIFVIFQRLHARGSYPGTGIGLAMCRKIIGYHGGRIWLDTPAGKGSRFCFTLPACPDNGSDDG